MDAKKRKIVREVIEAVRTDAGVLALILYGSAARRENSSTSDIDLCLVLTMGEHPALDVSGKKLEYSGRFPVHISIFQQLPLYVRQRVLREGKVLFCRDSDALYELAFITVREFEDFVPIYLDYLKEVADAG